MANYSITSSWVVKEFLNRLGLEFERIKPALSARVRPDLQLVAMPVDVPIDAMTSLHDAAVVIEAAALRMAKALKRRHISRFYELPLPEHAETASRAQSRAFGVSAVFVRQFDRASRQMVCEFRVLGAACR